MASELDSKLNKNKSHLKIIFFLCFLFTILFIAIIHSLYKENSQVVKTYDINKELAIDGASIKIKQVTLKDSEDKPANQEVGILKVTGYVTVTNNHVFPRYEDFQQHIDIFFSSQDGIYHLFENLPVTNPIRPIVIEKEVPLNISNFKIKVVNKQASSKKELNIEPNWKSKTTYKLGVTPNKYSFEPSNSLLHIVHNFWHIRPQKIDLFILPEVKDEFPRKRLQHNYWENSHVASVKFIGDYKNHRNVYLMHWLFGKTIDDIVVATKEQDIYLLIDNNDRVKLVDAGKLTDYVFDEEELRELSIHDVIDLFYYNLRKKDEKSLLLMLAGDKEKQMRVIRNEWTEGRTPLYDRVLTKDERKNEVIFEVKEKDGTIAKIKLVKENYIWKVQYNDI